MNPRCALLAIAVVAGAMTAVSAQGSIFAEFRTTVDQRTISQWLAQVNAHRPKSLDAAAEQIGDWSFDRLLILTNDIAPLVRQFRLSSQNGVGHFRFRNKDYTPQAIQQLLGLTDEETMRADVSRIAKRGLVLHTDIARYVTRTATAPSKNTALLDDGRHAGDESASMHWDVARTMLGLVPSPAGDETIVRWYQAMSAHAIQTRQWNLALPILEHALIRIPDDPRLLLHAGVLHETFGSDNVQNAVSILNAKGDTSVSVGSRNAELGVAERFLRRATVAKPDFAEASLRLGHVLSQVGNHEQAIPELRRAAAGTTDPALSYYAMLLLGREEGASGQPAAAYAALEKASALFPLAQSPLLAESQLARREDDFARVAAVLKRLERLPPGVDGRHDPWWVYDIYAGRDADALIAAFYESYRKGDPR